MDHNIKSVFLKLEGGEAEPGKAAGGLQELVQLSDNGTWDQELRVEIESQVDGIKMYLEGNNEMGLKVVKDQGKLKKTPRFRA